LHPLTKESGLYLDKMLRESKDLLIKSLLLKPKSIATLGIIFRLGIEQKYFKINSLKS
jgi:hypothetical protein